MLGVKSYERDYVESARKKVDADVAAYVAVAGSIEDEAFEVVYFNNLVIVLEGLFVHRLRGVEGKDGNPLNEVRLLASSLLTNEGVLLADKQIKLKPGTSVLGLAVGDQIKVDEAGFRRLAAGFFEQIVARFP
jgi:hypothetical protein